MRSLLVVLALVLLSPLTPLVTSAGAATGGASWASVHEADAKIRNGCRRYYYDYRFTPGPQGGTLELRLKGPHGTGLGGAYIDSATDPTQGRRHWDLCDASLKPGRYRILVQVTQRISQFESRTARGTTATFRLTR